MLGRLEVARSGQFDIRYDLMDGRTLEFDDERADDRPYVPRPFPPVPGGIDAKLGVEKSLRAPTLWAALHLAAERPDGTRPTVMISLTQFVSAFAETCADLIESWSETEEALPNYRSVADGDPHWLSCLDAAEDYFTKESFEYRLLVRGIAVHHGQMPGLLARRLKVAIDRGNVRVVIATSTLSEGVNIPVNTLLIPSVHRANSVFGVNEFSNLIGRAGRPGVATEGSALVVLPEREYTGRGRNRQPVWNRTWDGYEELVGQLIEATDLASAGGLSIEEGSANSALAILLARLRDVWEELAGDDDDNEFLGWLQTTAVLDNADADETSEVLLDTLDGLLIAAIQECEQLRDADLSAAELETELRALWSRTYAYVASNEEDRLAATWLGRGQAITSLYPDPVRRRQLYKTSLAPRSGTILLDLVDEIRAALQAGSDYADRPPEQQFQFVRAIIALLGEVPAFKISTKLGRKKGFNDWEKLLRWWLFKSSLKQLPKPKELAPWFAFVADNFIYRGNWGLGSLVGVLMDSGDASGPIDALTIDDWPRSGLPWIAFWLKELVNWGTLDPVAAFLLARGNARDRTQAEADARDYYAQLEKDTSPNDALDPRQIRDWVEDRRPAPPRPAANADMVVGVRLERPAASYNARRISVFPLAHDSGLRWIDPAGYAVAQSDLPKRWDDQSSRFRFELAVDTQTVTGEVYQPHRFD